MSDIKPMDIQRLIEDHSAALAEKDRIIKKKTDLCLDFSRQIYEKDAEIARLKKVVERMAEELTGADMCPDMDCEKWDNGCEEDQKKCWLKLAEKEGE
jgi:hypothetical protein